MRGSVSPRSRTARITAVVLGLGLATGLAPAAQASPFDRPVVSRSGPSGLSPRTAVRPPTILAGAQKPLRYSTLNADTIAGSKPLTTFTKAFTHGGRRYPYTMVGTDPSGSATTTTVANRLTPVALRLGTRTIAPSSTTISTVTGSGLFTSRTFPGGTSQYGDVFMRTQFWGAISSGAKNWHVKMAAPVVKPVLTLTVPSNYGTVITHNGVTVALVDVSWLDRQLIPSVIDGRPAELSQFLAGNVVLCDPYDAALSACGIAGYHSYVANPSGAHTYSYQAYLPPALFGAGSGFHDIGPMSHELAEWLADPYVNNIVPEWFSTEAEQYGCMNVLESADPVADKFLTVNGLTYSDNAYLPWFARSASSSWKGRYTWLNTFTTYSSPCP